MREISQVFLSYSSSDIDLVRRLYHDLRLRNINVWFDKDHLSVGPWLQQIEKAIYRSQAAIFCLSDTAISKLEDETGVQQHEISIAYEIARKLPPNEFSIIPVRLEDCGRGDHRLSTAQQFDLFENWATGIDRLAAAISGVTEYDGLQYRANTYFLKGDYINAYASLVAAETIVRDDSDTLYLQGVCLFNLNRFRDAVECFLKAERLSERTQKTAYVIAQSLFNLGEIRQCRNLVTLSLKTWPNDELLKSVERGLRLDDPSRHNQPAIYDVVVGNYPHPVSFSAVDYRGSWRTRPP